ncbi:MAG: hypothetical protein HQK52_08010 [Oligoflexia bacterium]|nr:hypothetical protein [Oligoflexia bacterium]
MNSAFFTMPDQSFFDTPLPLDSGHAPAGANQGTANKAHASASSGPLDTSKTRYNAVKSGIFSSNRTLATQWEHVFSDLIADVYNDLAPTNEIEGQLCTMLAADFFRMNLLLRYEYGQVLSAADHDPGKLGASMDLDKALKISKYATGTQNRILKTLSQYKAMRATQL